MSRAQNPDPLFNCVESLSLCTNGRACALFTDIVTGGTWMDAGAHASVMLEDAAFSTDGMVRRHAARQRRDRFRGIYGDRAFDPTESSLCPSS